MKIIAFVPIKTSSKRLKNKNTRPLSNGKSILNLILSTLSEISLIDEIYVFSSDISLQGQLSNSAKFLLREKELDEDNINPNAIIESFQSKISADIYVLAHATAPFTNHNSITKSIKAVLSGKFDSAFSAREVQNFTWFRLNQLFYSDYDKISTVDCGEFFRNYDLKFPPRTQDMSPMYSETSGFYVLKSEVFKLMKQKVGVNPYICLVNKLESIDIDDLDDFLLADQLIKSGLINS